MQSISNTNSENNNDNQSVPISASESHPVHTYGRLSAPQVTAFGLPPVTTAGPFTFGGLKPTNTQSGGFVSTGVFGTSVPQGCCNPFPPNTQRHPETGIPIPKPTQPVFGFRCDQQFSQNVSKDKLIEELYAELRRLQEHVNESNKLIGSMYELLRKL